MAFETFDGREREIWGVRGIRDAFPYFLRPLTEYRRVFNSVIILSYTFYYLEDTNSFSGYLGGLASKPEVSGRLVAWHGASALFCLLFSREKSRARRRRKHHWKTINRQSN